MHPTPITHKNKRSFLAWYINTTHKQRSLIVGLKNTLKQAKWKQQ